MAASLSRRGGDLENLMHGTVMWTNRRGRKRKFRGSKPGSREVQVVELVSPADLAASMPHRRALKDVSVVRFIDGRKVIRNAAADQKAVSELGRMSLIGRVSEHMERAGSMFAGDYGAYMATTNPPNGVAGSGRGFGCVGEPDEL